MFYLVCEELPAFDQFGTPTCGGGWIVESAPQPILPPLSIQEAKEIGAAVLLLFVLAFVYKKLRHVV
jgi:hypothetical protein